MAKKCRIVEGGYCEITNPYSENHKGLDVVGKGYTVANITAHSDGEVVELRTNCNSHEEGGSYGNYIKLKHNDGYYTLYAHIAYGTIKVKKGDKVKKGSILGRMGDTGYAFGIHLHWEVRDTKDVRINPTEYLNKDLPKNPEPTPTYKWNTGDYVSINGVYVSSDSKEKLTPAVDHGKITRIVEARNPYLLNDGNIGWVNDDCITGRYDEASLLLLVKLTIRGDFGNGEERKQRLGGRYTEVQNQVNLNYAHGTTDWDNIRIY